jgi:hypothetical protein
MSDWVMNWSDGMQSTRWLDVVTNDGLGQMRFGEEQKFKFARKSLDSVEEVGMRRSRTGAKTKVEVGGERRALTRSEEEERVKVKLGRQTVSPK